MSEASANRPAAGAKRTRRSATEVRDLLLDAARELFVSQGYANTATRDIALKAGVSEALLFRHFGNKATLFEKAAFEPFETFISEFVAAWRARTDPHTPDAPTREYIEGLYRLLRENRKLIIALLAADTFEDLVGKDTTNEPASTIGHFLDRLEEIVRIESERFGYEGLDHPLTTRAAFALVLGMATFDPWLFPVGKRRPSEARVFTEMVDFLIHGVGHRSVS